MATVSRRGLLAGALAPAVLSTRALSQRKAHTNVVFLLGDDHRWDAVGCMGNRVIRTPHLDRLAAGGARFENAFVTTAICVTSRASFFTGLYARSHGIHAFRDRFAPALFAKSYPALLKQAGFRNGFVGKWGIDGGDMPVEAFDYFKGFQGQGKYFPEAGRKGKHLTETMGDQMVEFVDACTADQPFHLSVSFKAPHVQDEDPLQFLADPRHAQLYADVDIPMPETADARFVSQLPLSVQGSEARRRWAVRFSTPELYQRSVKNYYRMITGIDDQVGRLMEALERRGLAENTVVVYAGDNGFYLGEHGLAGKWFMHEESIRVPLIVYDPRTPTAQRGQSRREMALNIDVAPTLLEFAGVNPPASMQGRSVVPLVRGAHVDNWRREWFYEHLFENEWIPKTEGIRTADWKYTEYLGEDPRFEELFHLATDSREVRNLAKDQNHVDTLGRMRQRRQTWLDAFSKWTQQSNWAQLEPRV
ncbi:MAG: sulfatase [Bryobacterales bacterium]|jgi:arylsulfatase A-like enzyme|nr:sulfatase [Bryobacterales bacterium]